MSYIPRSSLTPQGAPSAIPQLVKKKRTFRVFGFLATFMIVASLLSAISVYAYRGYLLSQLDAAKIELAQQSSDDVNARILELENFNRKLSTAESLLMSHLAPSRIFTALEEATKSTVQIVSFNYSYDPGFQAFLDLSVGAKDINSIALQNIEFMKSTLLIDPVVDGISITAPSDEEGADEFGASFTLQGSIEKKMIAYDGSSSPAVSLPVPAVVAPTTVVSEEVDGEEAVIEEGTEEEVTQ